MIASGGIPAPEARELRACGLAALAEAGVVYLPLHLVLSQGGGLEFGAGALVVPFVLAYVGAALLACLFRSSRVLSTGALVLAVLAGVAVAGGDLNRSVFTIVIALLLALRIVSLGLRDWRTPLHAEIGWFALVLGLETLISSGPEPGWRPLLVAIVPLFFTAAFASRASTVWTSGGVLDLDERVRSTWIRRAAAATGALVGTMALAVVLAVRGGLFDRIGRALTPVAEAIAAFIGWALGQAARPVFWLVDRLGIDPGGVREFFRRLREGALADRVREQVDRPDAELWQRLLGLLAFAAIGYAIYRAIRRARPTFGAEDRHDTRFAVSTAELPEETTPATPSSFRAELPADAVRRWYAEALIALRARGVVKPPAATPAEFVVTVARAYPSIEPDFLSLTSAYQDVRYGALEMSGPAQRELGSGAKRILAIARRQAPAEPPPAGSPPARPAPGDA